MKNIIFSFILFEEKICRVDFPHAFQDFFLIEIPIPGECSGLSQSYLNGRNTGYDVLIILRSTTHNSTSSFTLCQQLNE
jgi:hypothetical protein